VVFGPATIEGYDHGDFKMKHKLSLAALIVLSAAVIGCTAAPNRVLLREYAGNNYCHMKLETYGDPAMPTEREVVDFYGPCDERPSSRDPRMAQTE
jgi:hypothetical protein